MGLMRGRQAWSLEGRSARSIPLALLVTSAVLFGLIALDVVSGGLLARTDPHVARWSFEHISSREHIWLRRLTHLGDSWLLTVLVVLGMAWLARGRRYVDAATLAAAGAVAGLTTAGLKEAFHRSRPPFVDSSELPHSFSFPSGHASGAFAVYVLLALLLTTGSHARVRMITVGLGLAVATLVAATRVLLPVHYLTDVIAGGCVGLAVAAAALLARELIDG